jgi:replicative DNA helicase
MPLVRFDKQELTFSFDEANKLLAYMEKVGAYGGHKTGKCLDPNTPVIMFNGKVKKISECVPGDLLMGDDNTPRKVLSINTGNDNMYEVIPKKGESFICNEYHILVLKKQKRNRDKSWWSEIEVPLLEYINSPKRRSYLFRKDITEWPEAMNVPLDPYFLGLWLGDGTNRKPGITTMDKEIVNYLNGFAETCGMKISILIDKRGNKAAHYSITNGYTGGLENKITNKLRSLGLFNTAKHIPFIYKTGSFKTRVDILAGLIDSDGWKEKSHCLGFANKNKQLANDVVFICKSIGLAAYIKNKIIKNKIYYIVSISGDCSIIPLKINRKKLLPRKTNRDPLKTKIKEIKNLGYGEWTGITIDGNGRFLLGDFTITHNTAFDVMQEFDVLELFTKIREIVRAEYDD